MNYYRPGSFQILPPVVKNLLIINILFFVATFTLGRFGINLIDLFGLHYFGSEKFRPFQFFTYMFMHGGFSHILFNMFALWMFGYAIENFWGPKRFLIYYLVTGIGAALIHYGVFYLEIAHLLNPINNFLNEPSNPDFQQRVAEVLAPYYHVSGLDISRSLTAADVSVDMVESFKTELLNTPVVVGASGAVFGILLAFGMMFPNSPIYIYFLFPIKAKYFVILYGVLELFTGISRMGESNIAHFAHVGGMLFGFILLKYWKVRRLN
ncbi:MAG TPA: rhomboid family intramembrane serine protease [Bacteroidia bacterium]|nr:rhomboid family intramembrane serine protease [Bacteroidia bacterium]HRS58431.1 rhomboid family intramembrane serine protease [Bacteroidia bacterium]HRU68435.1 rhomboid family intramembrane serine protease [Bacteroidia bacterium]